MGIIDSFLNSLLDLQRTKRPWAGVLAVPLTDAKQVMVGAIDSVPLAMYKYTPSGQSRGAILLLHGLGANRFILDFPQRSLAQYLCAKGYTCYVAELRGAGNSGIPKKPWGLYDYLHLDIPPIIEYILSDSGADKVHWVGHSMGGILLMLHGIEARTNGVGALGEHHIGQGCVIAGALDYRIGESEFAGLLPYLPLIKKLGVVPWDDLMHFSAPFLERVPDWFPISLPRPIEDFNTVRSNIEPKLFRRVMANMYSPISAPVLVELAEGLSPEGFCHPRSGDAYMSQLEALDIPLYLIGGSEDKQCPAEAVRATFDRLPSKSQGRFDEFGAAFGQQDDYGHLDLVLGKRAPEEVWPHLLRWIEQ